MENTIAHCKECNTPLQGRQKRYCSRKCHNKSGNTKYQNYRSQQDRGLLRKLHLISKKGGCCEICGYSRNTAALCFHHQDPAEKELKLDLRSLSNNTLSSLEAEADKCLLLCHNCHMELHHPDLTLGTPA